MTDQMMEMSLLQYRWIALMSLWTGLIVTVGMVFALIPNIELILLTAFLGGIALGPRRGLIVAVVGEGIFSALNPVGSGLGFPVLYAFQIVSVGFCGFMGGALATLLARIQRSWMASLFMGGMGLFLTLFYDMLTALSFPISSGMVSGTLWATLTTGMVFFATHVVANTILFGTFGPGMVHLVNRQLKMHGLGGGQGGG